MTTMVQAELSTGARQSTASVASIVGFFFAVRALIPVATMYIFDANPRTGATVQVGLGFLIFGIVALELLRPPIPRAKSLLQIAPIRWAVTYLVVAACSLVWSKAASPVASLTYLCGTMADVAMITILLRCIPASELARPVLQGFIGGAIAVAAAAWIMPADYDLRLGNQDFFNANTIANICAFAIWFAQFLTRRTGRRFLVLSFFLSVTLLRSLSKTTIAAFLLGQAILLIHDRSVTRRAKVWLTVSAFCTVLCFWGLIEAYYDLYTTSGNQAETLTGRTAIWTYVLNAFPEQPWIGHGFDSMWRVVPAFGTFEARHAENEILQQLYAFGATGIVLLCGAYSSLCRAVRSLIAPERIVFRCLLVYVVVRGLAEAEPFDLLLPLWAIALVGAVAVDTRRDLPAVVAGHNSAVTGALSSG